ncbi:MAG: hypothetical protein EXQ52_12300 [Bryobacterales bacterium]|nr:hypothetical protein [Bryobacterales bacterium]
MRGIRGKTAGFQRVLTPGGQIAVPQEEQIQVELQRENDDWRTGPPSIRGLPNPRVPDCSGTSARVSVDCIDHGEEIPELFTKSFPLHKPVENKET